MSNTCISRTMTASRMIAVTVRFELCHEFKNDYCIFTDGSKEGNRVAAAVVHRDNTKCVRLPDTASIFRAELYALLLAIDVVRRSNEKNFVIFSDFMSSLQSINGFNLDSDLVQKFLKDYTLTHPCGFCQAFFFQWDLLNSLFSFLMMTWQRHNEFLFLFVDRSGLQLLLVWSAY